MIVRYREIHWYGNFMNSRKIATSLAGERFTIVYVNTKG